MLYNAAMFNPDRAKQLIKERGRTRAWVADQCCVSMDSFAAYMCGARQPSQPVLKLMAQALECEIQDLDDPQPQHAV
jgi:transcriptional regulator with XRE-family HTH domain